MPRQDYKQTTSSFVLQDYEQTTSSFRSVAKQRDKVLFIFLKPSSGKWGKHAHQVASEEQQKVQVVYVTF